MEEIVVASVDSSQQNVIPVTPTTIPEYSSTAAPTETTEITLTQETIENNKTTKNNNNNNTVIAQHPLQIGNNNSNNSNNDDDQVSKSSSSLRSVRSTTIPSVNKSPPSELSLKKNNNLNDSNNKQVYIRRKKCDVIFTRISYKHLKSHADFYSKFSLHQTDETKLQTATTTLPNSSNTNNNLNDNSTDQPKNNINNPLLLKSNSSSNSIKSPPKIPQIDYRKYNTEWRRHIYHTLKDHHEGVAHSSNSSMNSNNPSSYQTFLNSLTQLKKNVLRSKGRDFTTRPSNDKKLVRYVVLQPSTPGEFINSSKDTRYGHNNSKTEKYRPKHNSSLKSKITKNNNNGDDNDDEDSMSDDEAIDSQSSPLNRYKTSKFTSDNINICGDHSTGNATGTSLGDMSSGECTPSGKNIKNNNNNPNTALEIHMRKKRARMKTLSTSSSNRTEEGKVRSNFKKQQMDSDEENTSNPPAAARIRNNTENSENKYNIILSHNNSDDYQKHNYSDYKTSDYTSTYNPKVDSDISNNLISRKYKKFQNSRNKELEHQKWVLNSLPGSLLFYESEKKYLEDQSIKPCEVLLLDRVWACYKRELPSRKKRYLLELFTDDGYVSVVLDDPISLDEWYKEINDEIGQAKNTLRPHIDNFRPNYVYNEHHNVKIAKVVEVSDQYGYEEVDSISEKRSEMDTYSGNRWLCIEKDSIHILKPVGGVDQKLKDGTLKVNTIEVSLKHDNIMIMNRGKRNSSATPWVSIIVGKKDPIFSWQRKNNERRRWQEKRNRDQLIKEQEIKRRTNKILYEHGGGGASIFAPGTDAAGRREQVFRDEAKLYPKEEGVLYYKFHIELKDWEYAKQIHEDLKIWKAKLKERYVHAGAEGPVDTSKTAPGLRYRTFDTPSTGLDPGKLVEMSLDDLFSEKLRMETTRTNKNTDIIYQTLVRLILERQNDLTEEIQKEISKPIDKDSQQLQFLEKRHKWQEEAREKMREIEKQQQRTTGKGKTTTTTTNVQNSRSSTGSRQSAGKNSSKNNNSVKASKRNSTASSMSQISNHKQQSSKNENLPHQETHNNNETHINNETNKDICNSQIVANVASENNTNNNSTSSSSHNSTHISHPHQNTTTTPISQIQEISQAPPVPTQQQHNNNNHFHYNQQQPFSQQVQTNNNRIVNSLKNDMSDYIVKSQNQIINKEINKYQLEKTVATRQSENRYQDLQHNLVKTEDEEDKNINELGRYLVSEQELSNRFQFQNIVSMDGPILENILPQASVPFIAPENNNNENKTITPDTKSESVSRESGKDNNNKHKAEQCIDQEEKEKENDYVT